MESLLANISQESTKIQDLQTKCTALLDLLSADDDKQQSGYSADALEQILQIFRLCIRSEVWKLNALSIDLVRIYIRKTNENGSDASKEETICAILKFCREMFAECPVTGTTLEIFALLTEVVATFSAQLVPRHVIEIIELCHQQIKEYVLANSGPTCLPSRTTASSFLATASAFAFSTPRVSTDDKVLSTIYVTAGQVCHYYTKHQIIGQHATPSSVSSADQHSAGRPSQDFVYLLLYLSKKLECKLSFYRDIKSTSDPSATGSEEEQSKSELFILIKIYNCFYLKCLQYSLLTIPDAWKFMTTHLMEIVCKNLVPILVDILSPLSTIQASYLSRQGSPWLSHTNKSTGSNRSTFGRGTEKLHLTTATNKDFLYNTLNYQERQYIYKISLELLRLFGLENSMRPLLEALFHRVFLLPPLEQRLDSLIYMQEILKNPRLVLILMSNPICLFGASSSHSQNLDLFKIFMDAIKEASQADDIVLVQLSSLCLVTLLGTLDSLVNRNDENSDNKQLSSDFGSIWKCPTVKMILSYAETHRQQYESVYFGQSRLKSSYGSHLSKYHTIASRYSILNLKNRICGFDSNSLQLQSNQRPSSEMRRSTDSEPKRPEYHDRLNALIGSRISSESAEDSRNVDVEARTFPPKEQRKTRTIKFRNQSLHISLQDLSKLNLDEDDWITMATLKYTNSDSRLYVPDPILVTNQPMPKRELSYDSTSSVFEQIYSSNSSLTESKVHEDEEPPDDKDGHRNVMFARLESDSEADLRHMERALSHILIRKLRLLLPELVTCRNLIMVDEAIQTFSSKYCKDIFKNLKQLNRLQEDNSEHHINSPVLSDLIQEEIDTLTRYSHLVESLFINADGIYLAIYSALLLNMKLFYLKYYETGDKKVVPISESEFIDEIFDYHITIYLTPHFLAEIYQCVLSDNFLHFMMGDDFENIPLIKVLHDIDILDPTKPNAFKLSDYVRLEKAMKSSPSSTTRQSFPLNLIVKRFFVYFWDILHGCLRVGLEARFTYQNVVHLLEQTNGGYILSLCSVLGCNDKQTLSELRSSAAYIQMMQLLLNTSITVNCFGRLDSLYELFNQYISKHAYQEKPSHFFSESIKSMRKSMTTPDLATAAVPSTDNRLHLVLTHGQIVSMKTLLNRSSEIASHCPRVWRHVFDLCKFVTDLENLIFRSCHSSLLSRARISIGTILRSNSISQSMSTNADSADHYLNLYNFSNSLNLLPGINEVENLNMENNFNMLAENLRTKKQDIELKSKEMEQMIEYLSWFVNQIFENVALKFNLSLLSNFVKELCAYSAVQLEQLQSTQDASNNSSTTIEQSDFKNLMLFRLVEVILRFVRNGRPLLHFMKIWPVATSHLVDVSIHRELTISKKAITSMHDIINAVLSAYSEPDFFNFNESIFKSYERLLLFELCNSDCQQELLLNSICEFVEGASNEIRSGWKSIFKALRGIRLTIRENHDLQPVNCSHHVQILVDTFEAFLRTDNMHVFAHASVDFILCIFYLLRSVSSVTIEQVSSNNVELEETFIIFLKYVQKFCKILRSIESVPNDDSLVIAPHIRPKKPKLIQLDRLRESLAQIDPSAANYIRSTLITDSISTLQRSSWLLQLWLLVLDEFATTILMSDLPFRPMLLEVYIPLVNQIADLNGTHNFFLHCFSHIILPLIQNLLAETLDYSLNIEEHYMFSKSWLEVFNSHIIKYLATQHDRARKNNSGMYSDEVMSSGALLRQTLLVYIECLNGQYPDLISILALSLLRQLLLSLSRQLTSFYWDIVIDCFLIGHQMTLAPLKQFMTAFANLPLNSDLSRIKIMTTRTSRSSEHTRKRARQIFVGLSQSVNVGTSYRASDFKSFSESSQDNRDFTIIVETCTGVNQSLSYNLLISQLHNHLVLLQAISSVLTFNLKPTLSSLMCFMHEDFAEMCSLDQSLASERPVLNLTLTQYRDICSALKQSFSLAMQFDSRPGLKFLMQHICQTSFSANLYQMSALVWCVQFVVNFALSSSEQHRNEECLAMIEELFGDIQILYRRKIAQLESESKNSTTEPNAGNMQPFILQPLNNEESMAYEQDSGYGGDTKKSNPFNEETSPKVYRLVSGDSMTQVLSDYRRVKQMQSSTQQQQWRMDSSGIGKVKESASACADLDLDSETRHYVQHDARIFERVWSDILANCIQLHIGAPREAFDAMLPQFRLLVIGLIPFSADPSLRQSLARWTDHITQLLLGEGHAS